MSATRGEPPVRRRRAIKKHRPAEIEVGAVLGKTILLIGRRFPAYVGLALVAYLPWFALLYLMASQTVEVSVVGVGRLLINLVYVAGAMFLMGTMTYMVVEDLRGASPRFGKAMSVAGDRLISMVGIAVLTYLILLVCVAVVATVALMVLSRGVAVGVFALVTLLVLGFFLSLFSVSVPASIIERKSAAAAMARSAQLTHGVRIKIVLGAVVVYLIPVALSFLLVQRVADTGGWQASIAVGLGSTVLCGVLLSAFCAVVYHDLRTSSEGIDAESLAAVFR